MKRQLKTIIVPREAGFAIPIVLGVGLIMVLIAAIMLVRSQDDSSLATAQKSTNQALIAAETGITKIQAFLNRYRSLATRSNINTDKWSSFVTDDINGLGCTAPTDLDAEVPNLDAADPADANNGWVEIYTDANQLKHEYRLISYTYNDSSTQGNLIVEGRTKQNDIVRSTARLQVAIPISRTRPTTFKPPSIWARQYNLGGNTFQVDTAIKFGCNPPFTPAEAGKFVGKTSPTSRKLIQDKSLSLPEVPPLPPKCSAAPAPLTKPCYIEVAAISTGSPTFPQNADIARTADTGTGSNGEYIYYIRKSGFNSVNLDLTTTDKINIVNPKKVTIYLEGNFKSTLEHSCTTTLPPSPSPTPTPTPSASPAPCKSTNLQIFGLTSTQQITIKTNNTDTLDAFILAPQAALKFEGNGQIRGGVWVKTWGPSSKIGTVVDQPETPDTWEWADLPPNLRQIAIPPNVAPYTAWQRQETN